MFSAKAFTIASLILVGAKAFEVSTPSGVAQCGDTQISVSDATGQYHVSIVPAANPCESDALFESDALTGGSYTWKANVPAGTEVVIVVDDESGNEAWSGPFTIGTGDNSCLNASSPPSADSSALSTSSSIPVNNAYTSPPSTPTNVGVNSVTTSTSSSPTFGAPINAQGNNQPGAAFSNAQASTFTILAAMGVVALAL